MYKYMYMFLKQGRSEMDDFERKKKTLVEKETFQYFKKILGKISKFLTDTLAKKLENIFSYSIEVPRFRALG